MQRIHFTVKDLARVRLRPTLGPVAETVFAFGPMGRAGVGPYSRWRGHVADQLRERPALAVLLNGAKSRPRTAEDLLCLIGQCPDDAVVRTLGLSRRVATTAVLELWQVTIAPYWHRVLASLDDECDVRGRIAMTGGVERLLATLHPKVTWRAPVLEVPGGPDADVRLDGRGLLLYPSLFLVNRPAVVVRAELDSGLPALAFAAPADAALWDEPGDGGQALAALVGQTRAAVLRALTATRTTSQLAEQLGISLAGASQHTAVLRQTGLITTRRMRNTVLHTVTPLGMALLGGKLRSSAR
ncbi:MAG TPA: helix-turn-helix domain-containing protein [Pseudonocardiaceae bacterium]|nr:helix-turn-helix domain-containing protein [Pseudonocardiaceae bacterium]